MNRLFKADVEQPPSMIALFRMQESWYGIDTLVIQEVVHLRESTPVESALHYIRGILNLRGKIVTVLDLAARIGLGEIQKPEGKPIIIIPYAKEQIGLLVDEIDDVITIDSSKLDRLPAHIPADHLRYFRAVHREKDRLVTVLRPETCLAPDIANPATA